MWGLCRPKVATMQHSGGLCTIVEAKAEFKQHLLTLLTFFCLVKLTRPECRMEPALWFGAGGLTCIPFLDCQTAACRKVASTPASQKFWALASQLSGHRVTSSEAATSQPYDIEHLCVCPDHHSSLASAGPHHSSRSFTTAHCSTAASPLQTPGQAAVQLSNIQNQYTN